MTKVTELFAYVARDPDGKEGIASIQVIENTWLPLVTETREQIAVYRPLAEKLAQALKNPVILVRFSVREDLETVS